MIDKIKIGIIGAAGYTAGELKGIPMRKLFSRRAKAMPAILFRKSIKTLWVRWICHLWKKRILAM